MPPCSLCPNPQAIYTRPYSGLSLCRGCFTSTLKQTVQRTISQDRLLTRDDRIAIALSGGKDSLSLLHILTELEKRFPEVELLSVTIDEGVRGYREESLEMARDLSRRLHIPHHIFSFKDLYGLTLDEIWGSYSAEGRGALAPCSLCGVLRRKALNRAARILGASKVATAHNLDDEAQTVLMNLLRGDPARLLRDLNPTEESVGMFVPRVKPLKEIPEEEVALYAYLEGLEFQSEPCPYSQMAFRGEVRTFLNGMEKKHPGTKYSLVRSMEKIRSSVGSEPVLNLGFCRLCGEPTSGEVCVACELIRKITA